MFFINVFLPENLSPNINILDSSISFFLFASRNISCHIFFFFLKITLIKNISQRILLKDEIKQNILEIDDTVSKFGLVDYTYLNIRNLNEEDSENIGKMGVWIFSELIDKETIQNLIKPEYLLKSCFVIIADLSRPVNLKSSIKKWLEFIYDTFSNIILKLSYDKQEKLRNDGKNFYFFNVYIYLMFI